MIYVFEGMNAIVTYYLKAMGMINIGINIKKYLLIINIIILIPLIMVFKETGALMTTMISGALLFFIFLRTLSAKNIL